MAKIIAAAIKFKGMVWPGDRHGHIIGYLAKTGIATEADKPLTDENSTQGFIDANGRFWDREDARDIAIAEDQIEPDHGTLYSEDLW